MKTAKKRTPSLKLVMETLGLGPDEVLLASRLLVWYKAKKLWKKNRDGRREQEAMGESILAIEDLLVKDPARKAELMNKMIEEFE